MLFSGKHGKEQKIEQLLTENYNRYYRLAMSYVHNGADAADIVQNGAYRAILHSGDLKGEAYAATWLYRIMLNEIFRHLQKTPQDICRDTGEDGGPEAGTEDAGLAHACENMDLQRALDAMTPKDKAVIALRFFEERKLEEIAVILEENVSTVKSRLYRGLKKLRVELGEDA